MKITTTKLSDSLYAASTAARPHLHAVGESRGEAARRLREAVTQEVVEQRIKDREDRTA